ncbi:MAG: XdhC family protein [Kiloniellaceae bacterium]
MPSGSTARRGAAAAPPPARAPEVRPAAEPEDIIEAMARLKRNGQPFALATVVRTRDATAAKVGAKAIVRSDGSMAGWVGGGCLQGVVRKVAAQALADGRARMIRVRPAREAAAADGVEDYKSACPSGGSAEVFVEPILPRPLLLVAGAAQTARALCDLGRRLGFAVTLAALPEDLVHMPDCDGRIAGFDLTGAPRADSSFVVVATQGKRDREALEAALATGAPYVAFIGSRRKAAKLKDELVARGADPARVAALRSPAGLDLGAVTPEEIALSVLAEIVRERRRDRPGELVEEDVLEGAAVETRIVPPAARGCCGEAEGA